MSYILMRYDVCFVLDQHAELDFFSASSLKQQSVDRHDAPLWHIILITSQTFFALTPKWCMLIGEAANRNFTVFGLIRRGLEPMIYHTWGDHVNHYTTDVVQWNIDNNVYTYQRKTECSHQQAKHKTHNSLFLCLQIQHQLIIYLSN